MVKDGQAWYSYGARTNIFLLVNYGFCFENNLNDSFSTFVRTNIDLQNGPFTPENMIAPPDQEDHIQEIQLKKNQLNEILIAYLRSLKKRTFFGKNSNYINKTSLCRINDLKFELHVMDGYRSFIKHFLTQNEKITTLEQDKEILKQIDPRTEWNKKMAVLYRSEKKKILHSQMEIADFVINILNQAVSMQ